tara:strand:+ start:1857 stop:2660 length:804 start_codon:yes stop_codon:yes gene_type:complete
MKRKLYLRLFEYLYRKLAFVKNSCLKFYDLLLEIITFKEQLISRRNCTFWGDKSTTMQHVDFLYDPRFSLLVEKSFENVPSDYVKPIKDLNISWRFHIYLTMASHCINLEGDFVECGVWYGFLSKATCEHLNFANFKNKKFHLFDSWEGAEGTHEKYLHNSFEITKKRFDKFPNVVFHRGLVPDSLSEIDQVKSISFLSLDMNNGISERQALEILYDRIVPGGIIYLDDFGWQRYRVLRKNIKSFIKNKSCQLLNFPCGSAIIIKSK